jgi:hypothetical protein
LQSFLFLANITASSFRIDLPQNTTDFVFNLINMTRDEKKETTVLYGRPHRGQSDRGRLSERDVRSMQYLTSVGLYGCRSEFSQGNRYPLRWVVYGLWVALATVMGIAIVRQSIHYHDNSSKEVFYS